MALYVNSKDTGMKRLIAGHTPVDNELNEQSNNPVSNKIITKEINELKKSVSDGKEKVATAITEKGVATESTDTFDTMAENIGKIPPGTSNTQILNTTMISGVVQCRVTHEKDNTLN